ncbi:MAG: helix-turn-helix domain-containing protein [Bacilli bacterium]|nr:helix-turn-helix domain-containing protein [Bacilli bacterium]MBO6286849.1 helix-turn-helix domain-containing protein [Bacilli bacterium]
MELGKKIRQLRYKVGLTQEQLANKLGIGPQSISKWENGLSMPDITTLPLLAETFGISIDDLFDLSNEQRLNRIENSLDSNEELPPDLFREYEGFLKTQLGDAQNKKRATSILSYLYWHRMNSDAQKAARYAKDVIKMAPGEKDCQWVLNRAEGHAAWDWNLANHAKAIEFWRDIVEENPEARLPYLYLMDNLLADHRASEAENYLERAARLPEARPVMVQVYKAHIALARYDEKTADRIIEELVETHPEDSACLFEAAQYYARKCSYAKAIELYERSFEKEVRRPRFCDELMGIADIYEIMGEYGKAAKTYDRIIDLLENEWGFSEDTGLERARKEKSRLLAKASAT